MINIMSPLSKPAITAESSVVHRTENSSLRFVIQFYINRTHIEISSCVDSEMESLLDWKKRITLCDETKSV